jgi:hypothetical protein
METSACLFWFFRYYVSAQSRLSCDRLFLPFFLLIAGVLKAK